MGIRVVFSAPQLQDRRCRRTAATSFDEEWHEHSIRLSCDVMDRNLRKGNSRSGGQTNRSGRDRRGRRHLCRRVAPARPLFPQLQTVSNTECLAAWGQERTHAPQQPIRRRSGASVRRLREQQRPSASCASRAGPSRRGQCRTVAMRPEEAKPTARLPRRQAASRFWQRILQSGVPSPFRLASRTGNGNRPRCGRSRSHR
jgi:hypothetical protein